MVPVSGVEEYAGTTRTALPALAFYTAVGLVGSERVATDLGEGLRLQLDLR